MYYNKLTLPFIIEIYSLFHAKHPPLVTTPSNQLGRRLTTKIKRGSYLPAHALRLLPLMALAQNVQA